MAAFAHERIEALEESGLVCCAACGIYDEPHRMRFNADASDWLCREAFLGQTACADEQLPCNACGVPAARRDLDENGECGCKVDAEMWLARVQVMAAHGVFQ